MEDLTGGQLSATDNEQQLIAVMLEGRSSTWFPALARVLPDADAFTDPERRLIWSAMLALHSRGEALTIEGIEQVLRLDYKEAEADAVVLSHVMTSMIWDEPTALDHAKRIAYARARRAFAEGSHLNETAEASPWDLLTALSKQVAVIQRIAIATGTGLPEPKPLEASLQPVKAFDHKWLPKPFAPWIADIAERMQCPPDYPAVAAMVALSSVGGRRFCIQPKEHDEAFTEHPHLWGALIGRPSLMKSPAMRAAMRPLRMLEKNAFSQHEGDERQRLASEIEAKLKREALKGKAKHAAKQGEAFDYAALIEVDGESSPCRRFIVNDASIEALGEVLRENPTGSLLYQDELAGLLAMLEKDGNQALRAFLLQAWSGKEGFTFDRIGRGTRRIEHCALSILGSIQPGVIAADVRAANGNGKGADGFLQRFSLIVWPEVTNDWRDIDRPLCKKSEEEAANVFQMVEELTPEHLIRCGATAGREEVPTFRFAPDAQERFKEWRHSFENRLRSEDLPPAFEGHLGKYRKLVPSLAVLIHIAEWQADGVSLPALERALAWADYLESHAARVYQSGTVADSEGAKALLRKLMNGSAGLPEQFTARQVRRKGWSGLSTPEDAERACEALVEKGWLIPTQHNPTDRGGRPTESYRLNPRALNG